MRACVCVCCVCNTSSFRPSFFSLDMTWQSCSTLSGPPPLVPHPPLHPLLDFGVVRAPLAPDDLPCTHGRTLPTRRPLPWPVSAARRRCPSPAHHHQRRRPLTCLCLALTRPIQPQTLRKPPRAPASKTFIIYHPPHSLLPQPPRLTRTHTDHSFLCASDDDDLDDDSTSPLLPPRRILPSVVAPAARRFPALCESRATPSRASEPDPTPARAPLTRPTPTANQPTTSKSTEL